MTLRISRTLSVNGRNHIMPFRHFESVDDARTHFSEEELLVFLNAAIIDHDRKKLRKLMQEKNEQEIEVYKKSLRFMS